MGDFIEEFPVVSLMEPVPLIKDKGNVPLGFIETVGGSAEVNGMTADDDEVLEV